MKSRDVVKSHDESARSNSGAFERPEAIPFPDINLGRQMVAGARGINVALRDAAWRALLREWPPPL